MRNSCCLAVALAILSLSPLPVSAWESDKAVEGGYAYLPLSDLKDEDGSVRMHSVRAFATAPLALGESLFLSLRGAYQGLFVGYEDLVFSYPDGKGGVFTEDDLPDKLSALDAALGCGAVLGDDLTIYGEFQPGIHSDFEDVTSKDVYYQGGLMVEWKFSEELSGLLGVYYGDDFGEPEVFPLLGAQWQIDDDWALDLFLPEYGIFSYRAAEWLTVGLRGRLEGHQFRLSQMAPWENTVARYEQVLVGPFLDLHFSRHVSLRLEGGMATARTFEFRDDDSSAKLYDGDLEDGAYLGGSLAGSF